jgi:hypothetical protein
MGSGAIPLGEICASNRATVHPAARSSATIEER